MNFPELQKKLISLTNRNITQTEIGESLGITRSTISTRFKTKSQLKTSELKKVAEYFDIYPELLLTDVSQNQTSASDDNCISIPVLSNVKASMGFGVSVYNESQTAVYALSRQLAHDLGVSESQTKMIFASGDSMEPTIEGGDSLLIDRSRTEIYDGCIYCVRIEGQLYAKRLQKIPPCTIVVISDNPKYKAFEIDFSKNIDFDFEVIGKIRWWGRVAK